VAWMVVRYRRRSAVSSSPGNSPTIDAPGVTATLLP
jgi:hypothetical protein